MSSPRPWALFPDHQHSYAVTAAAGAVTAAALFFLTPAHLLPPPLRHLRARMGCCSSNDAAATRGGGKDAPPDAGTMPAAEPLLPPHGGGGAHAAPTPPAAPIQESRDAEPDAAVSWPKRALEPIRDRRTGEPVAPWTVLSPALWGAIERRVVPPHLHGRRLRQLFSTERHGYNPASLRRFCDQARVALAAGQDGYCVLVVQVGDSVVGALLNVVPEWHTKGRRTFIGGPATVVFATTADGASDVVAHGANAEGNDRFVRCDDNAVMIGSGASGAAIRIDSGLTEVQCSPCGETFDGLGDASLLDAALARGERTVARDVGGVRGKVHSFELLLLTEHMIE